jgi:2-octaprenyl-6-methoxyphenol hydroxylase
MENEEAAMIADDSTRSGVTADIAVVGGGPAGLTAALLLARAGRTVHLVAPPTPDDSRTTALFGGSAALLDKLGLWPAIRAAGADIGIMRLVDDTGRLVRAPETTFDAAEIGRDSFGSNITNRDLNTILAEAVAAEPGIIQVPARIEDAACDADVVRLTLDDGSRLSARLAVAADGRLSRLRDAAGIATSTWTYPQSALVTNLTISRPHNAVCTEFHCPNGPYVLVPLPGDAVSIVLVEAPGIVQRLAVLDDAALATELARRAHNILGRFTVASPRQVFPLSGLIARRFATKRVAVVGEAAHVFPPIGAQGLNLGLRDVAHLAEAVAFAGGDDPGGEAVMTAYHRRRQLDVGSRTCGVDLADRALLADALPVQVLRAVGLAAVAGIGPLKRFLMREAMAPAFGAPAAMRAGRARMR